MKKTLAPSLLLLPLLIACQPTANAQQPDSDIGTLSIGSPVRGEITSKDRINYSDGSRSIAYDIDLAAGQAVNLEASGALCARLLVLHEGETVAGPNSPSCDSSSNSSTLALMATEAGRYRVAVSGSGAQSYGPFRLEAKALQVHRGDAPLQPGADVVDLLRNGSRSYRLDIRQSGYYVIDMRSTEMDSSLELRGNGVSVSDDDGGDGLNSRIRVPLEPGSYTLNAKSVDNKLSGMFQLSIGTGALPAGVRLRNSGALATDGALVHGVLAGSPREYQLRITQPGRIAIELGSDDFDTVLELRGNGVSVEDDDGGDGTNSRISTILQPGTYRVIARGLGEGSTGLFRLSATRQDLPAGTSLRTGGSLTLGNAATGLLAGSPHTYQVEVSQAGELVVDMTSDDFDAVLELHRDGAKVAEDDDGGGGSNARLSASVQPGTYTVVASSYGGGSASGLYELTARLAGN